MRSFIPGRFYPRDDETPQGKPLTEAEIRMYEKGGIKLTEAQKLNGATKKTLLEAETNAELDKKIVERGIYENQLLRAGIYVESSGARELYEAEQAEKAAKEQAAADEYSYRLIGIKVPK